MHKPVPVLFLHPSDRLGERVTSVPVVSEDWSRSGNLLMALVLGKRRGWDSETHLEDKKKKMTSVG